MSFLLRMGDDVFNRCLCVGPQKQNKKLEGGTVESSTLDRLPRRAQGLDNHRSGSLVLLEKQTGCPNLPHHFKACRLLDPKIDEGVPDAPQAFPRISFERVLREIAIEVSPHVEVKLVQELILA